MTYAQRTTEIIGKLLDIPKESVVVASTGDHRPAVAF